MLNKKIAIFVFAALALTSCNSSEPSTASDVTDPVAQTKARAEALLDASLWTSPWTIQGGEGVSFSLPEQLTYAGGGDTDGWSRSWVSEKNATGGSGDAYFELTNFSLIKCNDPMGDCSIDQMVPATPEELFNIKLKEFAALENCTDGGEVAVGNVGGHAFSCDFPASDVVFFYGSKGAYEASDDLRLLLGDKELSDSLFKNFLSTITVE